jgi:hypothetical protein
MAGWIKPARRHPYADQRHQCTQQEARGSSRPMPGRRGFRVPCRFSPSSKKGCLRGWLQFKYCELLCIPQSACALASCNVVQMQSLWGTLGLHNQDCVLYTPEKSGLYIVDNPYIYLCLSVHLPFSPSRLPALHLSVPPSILLFFSFPPRVFLWVTLSLTNLLHIQVTLIRSQLPKLEGTIAGLLPSLGLSRA